MMYKPMRDRNGQIYYVFDEDAAEEFMDFKDAFYDCMNIFIETLETLKDAVLAIDIPNIDPFPEPEMLPEPEQEPLSEPDAYSQQNDLPF